MAEYKCDAVVQTRLDQRTLATVAEWMQSLGYKPQTRSDLIRLSLEVLEKLCVESYGIKRIATTFQANEIIMRLFPQGVNPSNRGRSAMLHNLQIDRMRTKDLGIDITGKPDVPPGLQKQIFDSVAKAQGLTPEELAASQRKKDEVILKQQQRELGSIPANAALATDEEEDDGKEEA